MKSLIAFMKKEWMDLVRSGRLMILLIVFLLLGIMNPAIAKLTPWMMEMMAESLEETGLVVKEVTIDAMTSWTQFFKNIPIGLIVFVLVGSNLFTKEYGAGTLILVLTKGLGRYKVIAVKAMMLLLTWSACYWMCFGVTYGYNAYFWDNSVAHNLMEAVVFWWVLGIFAMALMVLFSAVVWNSTGVLLGTGGVFVAFYLVGMIPKLTEYMPTYLMSTAGLLAGTAKTSEYMAALVITIGISVLCIGVSVPVFNKKKL